jgi:hypothetical protein
VPPPPVCGAEVFAGALALAPELGVGAPVAWLDAVALADELALALAPLVVELAETPPEAAPEAVLPVDEVVDVGGGLDAAGEEVEDPEHPASATTRMAKTPKPLTVGIALSTVPAMVPRTVM